jgi:hypothetical protein
MNRTTVPSAVAAVGALWLAVTGCGVSLSVSSTPAKTPVATTTSVPHDELIAFADGYCQSVMDFGAPLKKFVPDSSNPQKLLESLRRFLRDMSIGLVDISNDLDKLNSSIVPAAGSAIDDFREAIGTVEGSVDRLRDQAEYLSPNDPNKMRLFLNKFGDELRNITDSGASLRSLERDPELRAAAEDAPNCSKAKDLTPVAAHVSATPTS